MDLYIKKYVLCYIDQANHDLPFYTQKNKVVITTTHA